MAVLIKALFICMTVTSVAGEPVNVETTKCIPIQQNLTNAINESVLETFEDVRTFFFTSTATEDRMIHGDLVLDAEMSAITEG